MPRRTLIVISALLFVAGFLNDPPWKGYSRQQFFGIQSEPLRIALNLVELGEFANPFFWEATGPTAHAAPVYPYLLAALLKIFGDGPGGWLAVRVLATTALSLQFALLPWVARRMGFSVWTGALAALFGILVKPAKEELWETHFAGLLIMLLAVAMLSSRLKRIAILAGLSILVQPVIAGVYGVWALTRRRWLLAAVPLAIVMPWIVRNYLVLGGVTFIRDDLGIEMAVSFNDCAPYGIRESEQTGCFLEQHPNTSLEKTRLLRTEGEIAYNRRRMREGLDWIKAHPARTLALIAQRTWFFWFPSDYGFEHYRKQRGRLQTLHLFTALSFGGLVLALRRDAAGARILALWLAVFPLIYYAMQFEERYRYPILWITWLLAACVFEPLYSRRDDHTA